MNAYSALGSCQTRLRPPTLAVRPSIGCYGTIVWRLACTPAIPYIIITQSKHWYLCYCPSAVES